MQSFDKEKNIENILQNFKALDRYYVGVKNGLMNNLFQIANEFYPQFEQNKTNKEYFDLFAMYLINSTESVVEKDKIYTPFRLSLELETTENIALKMVSHKVNIAFEEKINHTLRKFIVENFKQIYSLSGDGFRLLEKNIKIFNFHFLSDFYNDALININQKKDAA